MEAVIKKGRKIEIPEAAMRKLGLKVGGTKKNREACRGRGLGVSMNFSSIPSGTLIFIDANIFLYGVFDDPDFGEIVEQRSGLRRWQESHGAHASIALLRYSKKMIAELQHVSAHNRFILTPMFIYPS